MSDWDYDKYMAGLTYYSAKFGIGYELAKKKLKEINESYVSIKTNYLELVNAPADNPFHTMTESECEKESDSEDSTVKRLNEAIIEGIDTFWPPEPLN